MRQHIQLNPVQHVFSVYYFDMTVYSYTLEAQQVFQTLKMSSALNTLTNVFHNKLWNPLYVFIVQVCERVSSFSLQAGFQVTREAVLESWPVLRGKNLSRKHCSSVQRLKEKAFQLDVCVCSVHVWVQHGCVMTELS